jgi:hypothetical protein
MTRSKAIEILARIISPVVGRYLAERVAERLYDVLSSLDREATDSLIGRAAQR